MEKKKDGNKKKAASETGEEAEAKDYTETLQQFKRTKITFDKGGIWKTLTPPLKDFSGKKYSCDSKQGCSLHLHSVSSKMRFGPFYTTENSIGIIIGTGNVGNYLSYREDLINTYLSRDGGNTWYEVNLK